MTMRRFLTANHRTEVPRHHIAFDTETVPVPVGQGKRTHQHRLMLGRAVYWEWRGGRPTRQRWLTFRQPDKLWRWAFGLTGPKHSLWAWAHNLGFDLTAARFWEQIESGAVTFKAHKPCAACLAKNGKPCRCWRGSLCTGDPPTYAVVKTREGHSLKLCDTINFFPVKLAELGRWVGLDKLDMPGELGSDDDWLAYCERDVLILQTVVCRLLREVKSRDLGCLRLTVASQSMQWLKHLAPPGAIVVDDD